MALSLGSARSTPLDLPPAYRAVALRESRDAVAEAIARAGDGAGTLVVVRRFDVAECAVVLEPEEPLSTARRAIYAGVQALADALAADAPPERPITIDWPDTIRFDGVLVGGVSLAWPDDAAEAEPPAWLVLGAMLRTSATGARDPGHRPDRGALDELGFEAPEPRRLVESFARHLMVAFDTWTSDGFAALARDILARLPSEPGTRRGLAPNGDLLVTRGNEAPERRALLPRLAIPAWQDPTTRLPWL